MKNFILACIFIMGVALPVIVILTLSPDQEADTDVTDVQLASSMNIFADDFDIPPPIISYDFSNGQIPNTQFVALKRDAYSDGALAVTISLPYAIHPQFWADLLKSLPTVPSWLPIMTPPVANDPDFSNDAHDATGVES